MPPDTAPDIQSLCESGQEQLMRMQYLDAERTLVRAESLAWEARDFDALARLYMPLQETRRQRRQRCGEGIVRLDLISEGPDDRMEGRHVVENLPHGQFLVAGWASIEPARQVRALAAEHDLFVETFLAAVYPTGDAPDARIIVIAPTDDVTLPPIDAARSGTDALLRLLPPHCIVLAEAELPKGQQRGSAETYGQIMAMWERLHSPFLADADAHADPIRRIEAYRKTIRVDYACELAHQKLADTARRLAKSRSSQPALNPAPR